LQLVFVLALVASAVLCLVLRCAVVWWSWCVVDVGEAIAERGPVRIVHHTTTIKAAVAVGPAVLSAVAGLVCVGLVCVWVWWLRDRERRLEGKGKGSGR